MNRMTSKQIVAMIAMLFVSACNDGELIVAPPAPSLTPPAPIILEFSADVLEIAEGGSVTLSYDVAGADTISISGMGTAKGEYKYAGEPMTEAKGSVTIENITETAEFVLTATKAIPVPEETSAEGEETKTTKQEILPPSDIIPSEEEVPAELTTTATLTITVIPKVEINIDLQATPSDVRRGEAALLTWSVEPSDVTISLSASSGENVVALSDCEGDVISNYIDFLISEIPAGEPIPAVGCAVVQPEEPETTYMLSVVDAHGNKNSAEVTVDVDTKAPSIEALIDASQKVVERGATVDISWNVNPQDSIVTITAEGEADCHGELPEGRDDLPEGTVNCVLNGTTVFTLMAERDGEIVKTSVLVVVKGSIAGGLDIQATPWAFAGETIQLAIAPAAGTNASSIEKILVNGQPLDQPMTESGVVTSAQVTATGVTVELYAPGLEKPQVYNPVRAVELAAQSFSGEGLSQSRILVDPTDSAVMLAGLDQNGYAKGIAKIAKIAPGGTSYLELKFAELTRGANNLGDKKYDQSMTNFLENQVKTFPVNAIAVQKNGRMIAATTGLIAYKEKGDWSVLATLVGASPYSGSHPSCFGKTQTGAQLDKAGTIAYLRQTCDLIALGEDRLLIATDKGVFTFPNVSGYLKDKAANPFCGVPGSKCNASDAATATFGQVVSDLEVIGDATDAATVLAATSSGVYQSKDGGMSWEAFGTIGQGSFALSYDKTRGVVYAGTANGVYVRAMNGGEWVQKGLSGTAVIALAVDGVAPGQESTLIAGTASGAKISRSSGVTWSDLKVPGMKEGGEVRSVMIDASSKEGMIDYRISVGGMNGGAWTKLSTMPTQPPSPPQEQTQEETE